jgi:hypothetical protein
VYESNAPGTAGSAASAAARFGSSSAGHIHAGRLRARHALDTSRPFGGTRSQKSHDGGSKAVGREPPWRAPASLHDAHVAHVDTQPDAGQRPQLR